MLDKNFVRENLPFVRERLAARGGDYQLEALIEADSEVRAVVLRVEELRAGATRHPRRSANSGARGRTPRHSRLA